MTPDPQENAVQRRIPGPMELVLVRHGETAGESSTRLNGVTDVALCDLGRRQMELAGTALRGEELDEVLVSPLLRSRESAAILRPGCAPRVVPAFREIDFGDWETLTWEEVRARDPESYAECLLGRTDFRFPGGESRDGFFRRVRDAALDVLQPGPRPRRVLAALHKGVIKIILCALLRLPWDLHRGMPCDLGSVHRASYRDGRWELHEANATAHLGELALPDIPPAESNRSSGSGTDSAIVARLPSGHSAGGAASEGD